MSSAKKLFGSVLTYASANVINSAIPFLLLPILTRVLSPAEYGMVAMFTALMSVLSAFTGLSIHGAVSVRYFDHDTDHPRFVGACLAVLAASTSTVLFCIFLLSSPLSQAVSLPESWLFIAVLASAAQTVIYVRLVIWQVQNQAVRYGFFQIIQTIFNLSLSLWLIFSLSMGWEGRAYGISVAVFVFGALAIFSLLRGGLISWSIERSYVNAALRFGVPLIPHSIGGMMMAMSDRFIVTTLVGVGATGSYAVGAQIGMIVGLLADAFNKAFGPHLLRELQKSDGNASISLGRQCLLVFLAFFALAVIYVFSIPLFYEFFVGPEYIESLAVAQWMGFGNAFMGMYYIVSGFIFFSERTGLLSRITLSCGFINVILTYLLVNEFGAIGAAVGYCCIQLLFLCGAIYLSQQVCPVPWRMALGTLVGGRKSG